LLGAVAAAGLFAAASPPFGFAAAAWLVPGVLMVATRRLSPRYAFEGGLLFGVLSAGLVTRWLVDSLTTGLQVSPLLASIIAFAGITLAVGIPCGVLTLVYAYASRRVGRADLPIIGAFLWVGTEWVRSQLFGWQLLGHTQYRELWLIQVADLGGVFAVSFVLAFASIAIAEAVSGMTRRALHLRSAVYALVLPLMCVTIAFAYGADARAMYQASPAHPVWSVDMGAGAYSAPLREASWRPQRASAHPALRARQVATVEHSGIRVSPLLCQDLLDASIVRTVVAEGADVLINDCRVAWLDGASAAATDQHLALAVLRAVETRRFVVRATNDGNAELITALGETHNETPVGRTLTISSATTRYLTFGDYWILFGLGTSMVIVGRGRRRV
jgi:apolipoprotein N-acyltransferase